MSGCLQKTSPMVLMDFGLPHSGPGQETPEVMKISVFQKPNKNKFTRTSPLPKRQQEPAVMHNFSRPPTLTVVAPREPVPGVCSECQAGSLQAYRVLSEGGWWQVVKCQQCLACVSRTPGPLLGPIVPLGSTLQFPEA